MELVFRTGGGLEVRDTCPDFEGHGLNPILKDGEVITYAGRRWLVHREPDHPDSYVCTPVDGVGGVTALPEAPSSPRAGGRTPQRSSGSLWACLMLGARVFA